MTLKPETKRKRQIGIARKLAKAAMIDKPEWKPAKGYKYLKDVNVGELIDTSTGLRGIVLDHTPSSTEVLVLKANHHPTEDRQFYLGKHRWATETEVKVIGD